MDLCPVLRVRCLEFLPIGNFKLKLRRILMRWRALLAFLVEIDEPALEILRFERCPTPLPELSPIIYLNYL